MLEKSCEAPLDLAVEYLSPLHQCVEGALGQLSVTVPEGEVRGNPTLRELTEAASVDAEVIPPGGVQGALRSGDVLLGVAADKVVTMSGGLGRVSRMVADRSGVSRDRMSASRALREGRGMMWLALRRSSDMQSLTSQTERLSPWRRLWRLARLESADLRAIFLYAAALGVLSLAAPIAAQALVNTVAFGGVVQPLIVLTLALFVGLSLAGSLSILQSYVAETLQRRFWVRVAEDVGIKLPQASKAAQDTRDLLELNNRFFDVITVQKAATELLLTGAGLALQTGVGILLLAFYHPMLMAFSVMLLIALAGVIWMGRGGTQSALRESKAKFAMGAWLDELARNPDLFSAGPGREFCSERLAARAIEYVEARRAHYRHVLAVLVGGVAVQVLAVVLVLAVGGYLVMERQLTLGQLVAAEIIVGAIAAGLGKLGKLAEKSFDSVAAMDKLGALFDLEQRPRGLTPIGSDAAMTVTLSGLQLQRGGEPVDGLGAIDIAIGAYDRVQVRAPSLRWASTLLETLAGYRPAAAGEIRWNGRLAPNADDLGYQCLLVRDDLILAGTVLDNLRVSNPGLTETQAWDALDRVGLTRSIERRGGLDSRVLGGGKDLDGDERKCLVLARVFAARPRLVLIDGALDLSNSLLSDALSKQILEAESPWWTVVVVTKEPRVEAHCNRRLELVAVSAGEE